MIPQTIAAILLAIPLVAIAVISVPYWIKFKDRSKRGTAKQETPYNKFFLYLVGLGYFCVWPFWIGGTVFLFLNKYYTVFGLPTFAPSTALAIQIVGFLVFYAGATLLNWAIFVAGKYLRPSIAGVYEEHKLIQTGPLYSGAEMVEMLTAAGFSRAWFEAAPDKGWGWLCALGVK